MQFNKFVVLVAVLVAYGNGSPLPQPRPRAPRVPMLDGKVVGGEPVVVENYPYQLSLQYFGSHICGASIISEKFAVTAAHCTDGSYAYFLSLRSGSTYRGRGGNVIDVDEIFQNPRYNRYNIDFDVSVLRVAKPFSFDASAQPVPLANEEVPAGTVAVVSGFGTVQEGGDLPQQLQAVQVPVVSREACREAYGQDTISENMICAGYPEGGRDSCQGDSGGPFVANGQLVGIVSWGYGCARPSYPGVYSNVANLRGYIDGVSEE